MTMSNAHSSALSPAASPTRGDSGAPGVEAVADTDVVGERWMPSL